LVIVENAYIAALPAERHSQWANCWDLLSVIY